MIAEYCRNYDLVLAPQVDKKIKDFQKLYQSEI
jgi:hypothetical protein